MIKISEKSNCCGCTACVSICPKDCISMKSDDEGFLYPEVDVKICIDCGLCEKVCPVLHPVKKEEPSLVYAAINNNETIRLKSSSGGIFTLIAEHIIECGGVVFGVCFDKNWNVIHDYTETKEGLAKFRGSKYVQSFIGNSFNQVKSFLDSGRDVLFSGTPCQVVGLKNYLRKSYSNLYTVDVVCHGVPSPDVWKKYLQETVCKRYNTNKKKLNYTDYISSINFRSKEYGWKKYNMRIEFKDGTIYSMPFFDNPYMNIFLSDLSLRPSCYNCPSKIANTQSDITLADFWGVDNINPEIDDDKGCGLVLIHNKEILDLLNSKNCNLFKHKLESVINYNPNILKSVNEPVNRDFFWYVYKRNLYLSYKAINNKSVLMRIIRKIYRYI